MQPVRIENPELQLLFACARWPQRDADRALIRELAQELLDWERFLRLVQHHRIVPIVARHLLGALGEEAPIAAEPVLAELKRGASANAIQAMRLLSELRRVLMTLRENGICVRVMKGLPLAQQLFGDISLRSVGDIDLLIDSNQTLRADSALRALGYGSVFASERFTPKQFAYYRDHWKDFPYEHAERRVTIDLHWRCFRNASMTAQQLCAARPVVREVLGGLEVETLPRREGLLYLCVHGTLDGWLYLKALTDVAAQVRGMPEQELDTIAQLAESYAVKPELTATLLLVRGYFGMDHWSRELLPAQHSTVRHITSYTGQVLEARGFLAPREEVPIGETLRFEWGLRSDYGYRCELIRRVLYRARMWETMPLPDWLFWAYPLLSPIEWVLFRMRRAADRETSGTGSV